MVHSTSQLPKESKHVLTGYLKETRSDTDVDLSQKLKPEEAK